MGTIIRTGQTLQLPSGKVVVVLSYVRGEATCLYVAGARGEIEFSLRWLERFAVVVEVGK